MILRSQVIEVEVTRAMGREEYEAVAYGEGETMMVGRVARVVYEPVTLLYRHTLMELDETSMAIFLSRPARRIGEEMRVVRFGSGEVYAVGKDGDRHQVSSIEQVSDPVANARSKTPDSEDRAELARHAEAMGVKADFERRANGWFIVVTMPAGKIVEPYAGSWYLTMVAAGLVLE